MNGPNSIEISNETIKKMLSSRIWMMILSIFIILYGILLCGLAAIFILYANPWSKSAHPHSIYILPAAIPNIIVAAIPTLIGILLIRYAVSIKDLANEITGANFSKAAGRQKVFWMTSGIITAVTVTISIVVILTAVGPILLPPITIGSDEESSLETTTTTCEDSLPRIVGSVQTGIALYAGRKMVESGSDKPEYPDQLDSASDGPAGEDNPLFVNVLQSGVTDRDWIKKGLSYKFRCYDAVHIYRYDPVEGTFLKEFN